MPREQKQVTELERARAFRRKCELDFENYGTIAAAANLDEAMEREKALEQAGGAT